MQEGKLCFDHTYMLGTYIKQAGVYDRFRTQPLKQSVPHLALGLCGEAGELRWAHHYMEQGGIHPDFTIDEFISELGDVVWYASRLMMLYRNPTRLVDFDSMPVNIMIPSVGPHEFLYEDVRFIQDQACFVGERVKKDIFGILPYDHMIHESPNSEVISERLYDIIAMVGVIARESMGTNLEQVMKYNITKLHERQENRNAI